MTIQLVSAHCNASKAKLQQALAEAPVRVNFYDPSIVAERRFTGADIQPGERFPIVMDPLTRMRFATLARKADGSFKVS